MTRKDTEGRELMPVDPRTLMLSAYARALGLRAAVPSTGIVSAFLATDLNNILLSIKDQIQDIYRDLYMDSSYFWEDRSAHGMQARCNATVLLSKISQLIYYLEHVQHLNSTIVEIGSLFNSIKDRELKERCSDLLSAPGNFDRAINQATLVLEDRLRKKSGIDKNLTGPNLVNAVINTSAVKGILKISDNAEEHEGIGHICRGLMLAFRNPTHHSLSDSYSREDALKLCAFIDNLIAAIDQAEPVKK